MEIFHLVVQLWWGGAFFNFKDFCSFISSQVVFTEAFRSKEYHSQLPPHKFKFKYNATHPYERKIGTQVLVDILLLAKCNVFLHAESSVAALASYFNPHMTSYFMDERPFKDQGKIRQRRTLTNETRKVEEQKLSDVDDFEAMLECVINLSVGSACPSISKGLLVDLLKVSL